METTINAKTIINAVMAAHAVAPEYPDSFVHSTLQFLADSNGIPYGYDGDLEADEAGHWWYGKESQAYGKILADKAACELRTLYDASRFITFRTSARGTHRIINDKAHLQRFADLVRKNAAAFGGGLIREKKEKPAVSYPSKSISLFKQLIEDNDYAAALQLAEEKLSPLFAIDRGTAYMYVAPIPMETEPRIVSLLGECGEWTVVEPVSMSLNSWHKSRQKAEDAFFAAFNARTQEQKDSFFAEREPAIIAQSAARAQWMAEHGIVSDEAITERIEQQAAQDVAEVVAQAVAVATIADAMAPSEAVPGLVTCEAESEAQESSNGNAEGFTVAAAYNTVTAMLAGFAPTPSAPAVEIANVSQPAHEAVPSVENQATNPAAETVDEPTAPSAVSKYHEILKERNDRAEKIGIDKTIEETRSNMAGILLSRNFCESIDNFFTRNPHLADKNRAYSDWLNNATSHNVGITRDAAALPTPVAESAEKNEPATRPMKSADVAEPESEPTTPDDYAKFNIRAKSGAWVAFVYMVGTLYGLRFEATGCAPAAYTYATHKERMDALEAMATALYTPEPTPTVAVSCAKPETLAAAAIQKAIESSKDKPLEAQYPQLKLAADNPHQGGKLAASNIRILLKEAFKGHKFSVKSDYSSVNVKWEDGPTVAQVSDVIGKFQTGKADYSSDYFYTEETDFSKLFGGVQYLFTSRETSDTLIQIAIDRAFSNRNVKPTVSDWRKSEGLFDWRGSDYDTHMMRETLSSISTFELEGA